MKQQLIIFTGLPGTGKSALAEAVGRNLRIPVLAKDWLEAALLQSGYYEDEASSSKLGYFGYELLTTLARRQLMLGQSAILDSVASTEPVRSAWRELATEYNARWKIIECICSDERLHRERLKSRRQEIPGWHELEWSDVARVKAYYSPWHEDRLILDMTHPLQENVAAALQYVK